MFNMQRSPLFFPTELTWSTQAEKVQCQCNKISSIESQRYQCCMSDVAHRRPFVCIGSIFFRTEEICDSNSNW